MIPSMLEKDRETVTFPDGTTGKVKSITLADGGLDDSVELNLTGVTENGQNFCWPVSRQKAKSLGLFFPVPGDS